MIEARYAGDVLLFARSATVAWPVCAERSRTLGFLSLDLATLCCEARYTEDIIPGQVCRCNTASLSCEAHSTETFYSWPGMPVYHGQSEL